MDWENVGITHERLNGLKLRVAQISPPTTVPKYIDHLLEKDGISLLTDKELQKELEVIAAK